MDPVYLNSPLKQLYVSDKGTGNLAFIKNLGFITQLKYIRQNYPIII